MKYSKWKWAIKEDLFKTYTDVCNHIEINCTDKSIQFVKKVKLLGVTLDEYLTFDSHTILTCSKINWKINIIIIIFAIISPTMTLLFHIVTAWLSAAASSLLLLSSFSRFLAYLHDSSALFSVRLIDKCSVLSKFTLRFHSPSMRDALDASHAFSMLAMCDLDPMIKSNSSALMISVGRHTSLAGN